MTENVFKTEEKVNKPMWVIKYSVSIYSDSISIFSSQGSYHGGGV